MAQTWANSWQRLPALALLDPKGLSKLPELLWSVVLSEGGVRTPSLD